MTSIGILGTGRVGSSLARALAAGHDVTLGHRQAPGQAPEAASKQAPEHSQLRAAPRQADPRRRAARHRGRPLIDVSNATRHGHDREQHGVERLDDPGRGQGLLKLLGEAAAGIAEFHGEPVRAVDDLGRHPEWVEDLGDITTARATEALVLLVPHVLRRSGLQPFAVSLAR
ncbi:NAD(P)-binding domain-containing protein [Streptomyces longisporoflavus]|uniref:NAD(P)-binding domain-containing protein n=1 Tax=Streptomyces longisporoflavus TaxID=28044 RepID=A0ABW7QGA7_9ACTN